MSWLTRSLSRRTIDRICAQSEAGITFDAVETGNPSPAGRVTAAKATELNDRSWHLPGTGGSDAHHLLHIGTGWTEFEGAGPEGLRLALEAGATTPMVTRYPSVRAVGIRQTAAGLVWGYAATPRKMLRIGTRKSE
jgi:predicted metal-dependent phosphoesterase TrpH